MGSAGNRREGWALVAARRAAIGWMIIGAALVATPAPWRAALFLAASAVQATQVVLAIRRRAGVVHDRLACTLIAIGVLLSGASGYATVHAPASGSPDVWHGWGLGLGVAHLTLIAVAIVSIAQPLLALVQLRRPVSLGLAGFVAAAAANAWGHQNRRGWVTDVLVVVVGVAVVALCISTLVAGRELRRVGRLAERYGAISGVLFTVGELAGMLIHDSALRATVPLTFGLAAAGFLVAMVIHPGADRLGQRLHRHTDRPVLRSGAIGIGALIAADGLLVALATIADGPDLAWWLGAGGLLQLSIIIWAIARAGDSGVVRTFLADRRWDAELRRAVRRESIHPYYQPILQTSDGRCIGFEALARWDHPRLGVLDGSAFLTRARERGLLATIDRQILQTVVIDLPDLVRPLAAERPFVSMNISSWRLEQRGFAAEVLGGLEALGASPTGLVFEVAATCGIFNLKALIDNIVTLQHHGVAIAIDDFGDGCGNLGLLCEVDLDLVKLDGPLIRAAMASDRGMAVLDGVVRTARVAGARIVAEGVEDFEWIERLGDMGVDYVQGFGIGYPAPVALATGLQAWRG